MNHPTNPIPKATGELAGPCGQAGPAPADDLLTLPRETLLAVEHRLRNHLNSLLMTAAALSLRGEGQGGADLYDQIERDVRACLDLLRELSDTAA